MLKSEELMQKLTNLTGEVKALHTEKKVNEAHAKLAEIENVKKEIEIAKALEAEELAEIENKKLDEKGDVKNMEKANFIRAMIKNVAGKGLTEEEKEVISNSIQGESYILPQDISTRIRELVREQKSFKNYLGSISTDAKTGSFPVEGIETVTGLVDLSDGAEIATIEELSFRQVTFSLKEKAGLIKLSNTLLAMTDNDLIDYVARLFARKAVATYNKMAVETLKNGKTVKELASIADLIKSILVDLDPSVLNEDAVIITNQDGFALLAELKDLEGVHYIQPDLSKAPTLAINGVPVVVFSNATLQTVAQKAPVFYGNLKMGASFVDAGKYQFATSTEAGFTRNMTFARVIDLVDCVQVDASDLVYVVAEVPVVTP